MGRPAVCHVLIIEDELLIALHLQSLLGEHGATSFDLAATESGAVQAALATLPGVIVSDVTLARGNGLAAVRTIHQHAGPIPVIFMTATPERCDITGAHVRVLSKPATETSIRQAFSEISPVQDKDGAA